MALFLTSALVYVAWATLNNWNTSQQNARQIQSNAQRYERERCVGLDVIGGIECITKTRETAADQERDEADLYAQRQMAVWAFLVAITAFVSIPLSLTGIFFVWRSLSEMRGQREVSQRAVDAANTANANTLKAIDQEQANSQRQMRAYITVIPDGINLLRKSNKVIGHVLVRNVGHVIAQEMRVSVCMELEDTTGKYRANFPIPKTSSRPIGSLPPTAEIRMGSPEQIPVSAMHLTKPQNQGATESQYIYVWGRVDYKLGFEVTNEDRYTRFCFRYDMESHDLAIKGPTISKDNARYHELGSDAN